VGPVGPTDKENQAKLCKKYCYRYITYLFETVRIRIRIKWSDPDPYQIEKQDPYPDTYQSEKQDPDPYQKGLDLQQCKNGT
jgi:hypothetical protein